MPASPSLVSDDRRLRSGDQPIDGYTLERPIGRGGFGEVWQANAPGNLKKAVKFVFGHHDDSRASREMRSLERIRGIRHPFLLTLERFEVIADRLIIVTELADGSLEDIYRQHRDAGSCGIPRETLLKNLADTADGLDYLQQKYGLQHLDVKPANLLMVGGHVKVADFGLLKDLREADCSVVGGLTPIYAPPELFDGRPSIHSDQYSLAVLYQEMLTGTRPFAGRTIAQLATQHVHSTPNLEPLPPGDRNIVAKALEKDPLRRFGSCEEFIGELRSPSAKHQTLHRVAAVDPATVQGDVADLPQIDDAVSSQIDQAKRLIVIAIGNTGMQCVAGLQRHAMSRCTETTIDAVLIDTDMGSFAQATVEPQYQDRFRFDRVHTPLRLATDYRSEVTSKFASISRRWIYNVSKDGRTQSVRPMGRLAMVDHGESISGAIDSAIERACEDVDDDNLSIFVVGSISGGTGGGMYIDVVHQLRHLLDERGRQRDNILSLMSIHPMTAETDQRLASHNTHAALIEINHFLRVENGYPGDEGAGFHSVPAARTPLRQLYLIPGHHNAQFGRRPVETIVQYMWNASHDAASLLRMARNEKEDVVSAISLPSIRTVGIASIGTAGDHHQIRMAGGVVAELLAHWLGTPKVARAKAPKLAVRISRRTGLTPGSIYGSILKTVGVPDAYPAVDLHRLAAAATDGSTDFIAAGISNQLQRELSISLGDERYDLATLIETINQLQDQCCGLSATWVDNLGDAERQSFAEHLPQLMKVGEHVIAQVVNECDFLLQRMECLAAIIAVATVQSNREDVVGDDPWNSLPQPITSKRDELIRLVHQSTVNSFLVRPLNDAHSNLDAASMPDQLSKAIQPQLATFIQQHGEHLGPTSESLGDTPHQRRVQQSGPTEGSPLDTSSHPMGTSTRDVDATQQPDPLPSEIDTVQDALAVIRPPLLDFGGEQRMLLMVANQAQRLELEPLVRQHHQGTVSVAVRKNITPTLVHEVQAVPLQSLITRFEVIGGDSQITSRLASRIDVEWSKPPADAYN